MADELQLDLLVGRQVVTQGNEPLGRIEEIIAEARGNDLVVTEYHIGTAAALERFSVSLFGRGVLSLFGRRHAKHGYRVPWDKLDLGDRRRPRLTCAVAELVPLRWNGDAATGEHDVK